VLEGYESDEWVDALAFLSDGQKLASGSHDKTVRLWNTVTGQETQKLEGHSDIVYDIALSPDGKLVASGSKDKTIRI
jgi:WD40 repeat protein